LGGKIKGGMKMCKYDLEGTDYMEYKYCSSECEEEYMKEIDEGIEELKRNGEM
jgi:hypothetical protein